MPLIPSITYVVDDTGNANFATTLNDGITNDTNFDLGGIANSADPLTTVAVYLGSDLIGQTTSAIDGSWSIADVGSNPFVQAYLANNGTDDGNYPFTASSNGVDFSAPFTVEVDTIAPTMIAITSVTDSVGVISDGNTNENDVLIEGTTDASSNLVAIYDGDPGTPVGTGLGVLLGLATVVADGSWQFQTNETNNVLIEGNHTFFAVATDGAGNPSIAASIGPILVDTVTPPTPVILDMQTDTLGGDPNATVDPENATDGITSTVSPTFSGTGEPGATLTLTLTPSLGGAPIVLTATVAGGGTWSINLANQNPVVVLADDDYTFSASQTDPSGNTSGSTTTIVRGQLDPNNIAGDAVDLDTITIDSTNPDAPAVLTYSDSGLQGDGVTNVTNGVFTGTAEPDSTITSATLTYVPAGSPVGTVPVPVPVPSGIIPVDSNGDWTLDLAALGVLPVTPHGAADGDYVLTIQTTDAAGNTSVSSAPFNVTIDTIHDANADGAADAPTIAGATDNVAADAGAGGSLAGQIQPDNTVASEIPLFSGDVTNDTTPTLSGAAEAGSTVNVFEVVNGANVFVGTATAHATTGAWSFTLPTQGEGDHSFVIAAIDPSGNFSSLSTPFNITVDTSVAAPTIDSYQEQTLGNTDLVLDDGVTNDRNGIIAGTAEAGSVVNHIEMLHPTNGLIVIDIDYAGNTVSITENGAFIDTSGNSITGPITVPAAQMSVLEAALTTDGNGDWSLDFLTPGFLALPLTNGDYDIRVSVTDPAGNVSPLSEVFDLELDTFHDGDNDSTNDNAADVPVVTAIVVNGVDTDPASAINTSDTDLGIKGTAEAGATVVVTLLGASSATYTVIADAQGDWELDQSGDGTGTLVQGAYLVNVVATDVAGNTASAAQVGFGINVATATPVIAGFVDNQPTVTSTPLAPNVSNDSTDDVTPQLVGSAEAGAIIRIYEIDPATGQGTFVNDAVADALGVWMVDVPVALAEGTHTFQAQATAGALAAVPGALSNFSQDMVINVDLHADKPEITGFDDDTGFSNTDNLTNDNIPTLEGTAEANATVNIFLIQGGSHTPIGTTTADANGDWTFAVGTLDPVNGLPTDGLPNGTYTFDAEQVDPAGNVSPVVDDKIVITVDTTVLATPVIDSISEDSGVVGAASTLTDSVTNDTTLTLGGTVSGFPIPAIPADPDNPVLGANATVNIYATDQNGVAINGGAALNLTGFAINAATGAWEGTLPALPEGEYLFTATSVDAAGNESILSAAVPMTIDLTGPAIIDTVDADTITQAAPNGDAATLAAIQLQTGQDTQDANAAAGSTSSLTDNNTSDTLPDLQGQVDPGSFVEVFGTVAGGTPQSLGMAVVDGAGNWTFVMPNLLAVNPLLVPDFLNSLTGQLPDANYEFSLVATDAAGNTTSSAAVPVTVDTSTTAPTVGFDTDTTNAVLDGLDAQQGNTIINTDIDNITNETSGLTLSGTAEAGSTITITDNFSNIGDFTFTITGPGQNNQVLVDAGGNWTIDIPNPVLGAFLNNDVMNFTVTAVDIAGNSNSSTQSIIIDTSLPVASINPLGPVSDTGTLGDGITAANVLTLSGTVSLDPTSNESVEIFNNGVSLGTALVTGTTWTLTTGALANDDYSFTVQATDAAGNVGPISAPLAITVDATATPPTITGISDDTGVAGDNITSDTSLIIDGTADANGTVEVFQDGVSLGTTVADGNGAWHYPVTGTLAEGDYVFTASVTDPATNTSVVSGPTAVTIDASTAVTIGALPATTDDTTLDVSGTAEAGAAIVLSANGQAVGNTTADGNGDWTITTTPLAVGGAQLSASATDITGNTATSSPAFVTITPPPANGAPVINSSAAFTVAENETAVGAAAASDAEADPITYSLSGADAAAFTIDATTGAIAFVTAPDYEAPASANSDNTYIINVLADDGQGNVTTQTGVTVEVTDVGETIFTTGDDSVTLPAAGGTFDALAGDDIIVHGGGFVDLFGGAGEDTISFENSTGAIWIDLTAANNQAWVSDSQDIQDPTGVFTAAANLDGFENIVGSAFSDSIVGTEGDNIIAGGGGAADATFALGGDDTMIWEGTAGTDYHYFLGDAGNDTADFHNASGSVWADLSIGGDDAWISTNTDLTGTFTEVTTLYDVENLTGSDHADSLAGDANDNVLAGGMGNDNLTGGAGSDTFVFESGTGNDTIFDYNDALDLIDVSAMDGVSSLSDFAHSEAGGATTLSIGNDSITLVDTAFADLADDDFLF